MLIGKLCVSRILELARMRALRWIHQAAKDRCQLKWSHCCPLRLFLACCAFTYICVSHRDASNRTWFTRVSCSEAWLPQRQESKANKPGIPRCDDAHWWERHRVQLAERQHWQSHFMQAVRGLDLQTGALWWCCARSVDGGITRILMLPLEAAAKHVRANTHQASPDRAPGCWNAQPLK